ncbi:MAG: hypothetical protein AAGG38_07950 [Planctomycetota bacterium]
MTADERTVLWSRNAKFLRVVSAGIGVLGGMWAVAILITAIFNTSVGGAWPIVMGLVSAVQVLAAALFVMALGRVVASIAEIQWFALNPPED